MVLSLEQNCFLSHEDEALNLNLLDTHNVLKIHPYQPYSKEVEEDFATRDQAGAQNEQYSVIQDVEHFGM